MSGAKGTRGSHGMVGRVHGGMDGSGMSPGKLFFGLLLLGLAGLPSSVWAGGEASFSVIEKFRPGQCGHSRAVSPFSITFNDDTWTAEIAGVTYTGSFAPLVERHVSLSMD